MKTAIKGLKKMSEEEIYDLYDVIDNEMENRTKLRLKRGYQRSTFLNDMVRGKRRAPRCEPRPVKKAA